MKCPKCGYLGFETVERCRHCGYDFSLNKSAAFPEFPMRDHDREINPLDDLSLIDAAAASQSDAPMANAEPDLPGWPSAPAPPAPPPASPGGAAPKPSGDLPLFNTRTADDEPMITRASPPRAPLAVRRATPEVPRLREEPSRPQTLDLGLELDDELVELVEFSESGTPAARATVGVWPEERPERAEDAAIMSRFVAVVIDLVVLGVIDLVVLYFTMQICGVSFDEIGILPRGPLAAFIIGQNGGYLVAFTAGGQTLGKMVMGIKVVATESAGSLDFGRAVTRTLMWMVLAVPAGLGFLTLFSRDHRGLHDRFAGTRVVRAAVY